MSNEQQRELVWKIPEGLPNSVLTRVIQQINTWHCITDAKQEGDQITAARFYREGRGHETLRAYLEGVEDTAWAAGFAFRAKYPTQQLTEGENSICLEKFKDESFESQHKSAMAFLRGHFKKGSWKCPDHNREMFSEEEERATIARIRARTDDWFWNFQNLCRMYVFTNEYGTWYHLNIKEGDGIYLERY